MCAESWLSKTGGPLTKLVLIALSEFANENGLCWPSVRTLAERCETSERSVRREIRKLEASGIVSTNSSRGRTSNRYTITRQHMPGCQTQPGPIVRSTRTNGQGNSDNTSGLTRTNSPPIRSVEPVKEPSGGRRPPISSCERIGLEKERDRKEAIVNRLRAQDFRSADDIAVLKEAKARIAEIDELTHIDL